MGKINNTAPGLHHCQVVTIFHLQLQTRRKKKWVYFIYAKEEEERFELHTGRGREVELEEEERCPFAKRGDERPKAPPPLPIFSLSLSRSKTLLHLCIEFGYTTLPENEKGYTAPYGVVSTNPFDSSFKKKKKNLSK